MDSPGIFKENRPTQKMIVISRAHFYVKCIWENESSIEKCFQIIIIEIKPCYFIRSLK